MTLNLYRLSILRKSVTAMKKNHTPGRKNPTEEATKGEAVKCEHMKMFHYTKAGLIPGTRIV